MKDTGFNLLPTIIGSLPHKDAKEACAIVTGFLKDIPCWPQLPNLSSKEGMSVQFSTGFPGIIENGNDLLIDSAKDSGGELERFIWHILKTIATNTDYGRIRLRSVRTAATAGFIAACR